MKMVDVLEQREHLRDLKKESPRKCCFFLPQNLQASRQAINEIALSMTIDYFIDDSIN